MALIYLSYARSSVIAARFGPFKPPDQARSQHRMTDQLLTLFVCTKFKHSSDLRSCFPSSSAMRDTPPSTSATSPSQRPSDAEFTQGDQEIVDHSRHPASRADSKISSGLVQPRLRHLVYPNHLALTDYPASQLWRKLKPEKAQVHAARGCVFGVCLGLCTYDPRR